jgi:hypothetical protein
MAHNRTLRLDFWPLTTLCHATKVHDVRQAAVVEGSVRCSVSVPIGCSVSGSSIDERPHKRRIVSRRRAQGHRTRRWPLCDAGNDQCRLHGYLSAIRNHGFSGSTGPAYVMKARTTMRMARMKLRFTACFLGSLVATAAIVARASGKATGYQYDAAGNLTRIADVTSDVNNCGAMNNVCASGNACCTGSCCSLSTDANNCGACGSVCTTAVSNAHPTCTVSHCGYGCNTGYCVNGAQCTSNASDPQRCGSACTTCAGITNGSALCTNGQCGFSCNAGYCANSGQCTSNASDSNNCGACGHVCSGGTSCQSAQCVVVPAQPHGLFIQNTYLSSTQMGLFWSWSSNDNTVAYKLYRNNVLITTLNTQTGQQGPPTSFTDNAVSYPNGYTYYLTGVSASGGISPPSASVTGTPNAPGCTAQSCGGCCNAQGQCDLSGADTSCPVDGTAGSACTDCTASGQMCGWNYWNMGCT